MEPTRRVTETWREEHVLIRIRLEREAALVDVDDVQLRHALERAHSERLRAYGMAHLDISEVRSKSRAVTQAISRDLYEQGAAGLLFRSNLDDCQCAVVFEGRGRLEPSGEPVSLADDLPELDEVCREFGLVL